MPRFGLIFLTLLALCTAAYAEEYDPPKDIDVTGSYTQAASGMIFPEHVLGFARTAITRYNSEGSEESADYELDQPDAQAAVTVYVFPAPADIASALVSNLPRDQVADALYMIAEQLFGDEEEAIQALHPGAELLDEGDTTITEQGKQFPGNYAAYRYDENAFGKRQRVDSKLYLFPMVAGKWMVKFRITAADANGTAQAEKFIRTLPWTIHNLTGSP